MGDTVVDPGAPNWLKELEEKREKRLRAKLGHEAGAGSPCLECKDKCPGLDLHFWRKICKNCRCGKENHDVQDDDVYGWVQSELLGSKPKKPQKIVLPGKNDEVELEWAPKGTKEAVETYLKDLPPELLPIKGSSAAQERKQLLQKQIPVHDVDPTLCHALTEEEMRQMNEYVNHLKEKSVGVGQLTQVGSRIPINAKLITTKLTNAMSNLESTSANHSHISSGLNLERNLQNLTINESRNKHDYENIDVFGKHKLEASLEEIERLQNVTSEEERINPPQAQYALLLDKSNLPIKDKSGGPIKTKIDVYANPIFDFSVVEKIGSLAKAEYAILLDKNGAPILNENGSPVRNRIEKQHQEMITDKVGNRISPQYALLLDGNHAPIKDKFGSPIRVNLDVFGAPIIERNLSEIVQTTRPEYACFLDKNGAPIVDRYGKPTLYNLNNLRSPHKGSQVPSEAPKYAVLLDKNRVPIKYQGEPVITNLDPYGMPILDTQVLEQLESTRPQYSLMLDKNRTPILDKHNRPVEHSLNVFDDPIMDKFGNEVKPRYGLLLDKNETPLKDYSGSPVKVTLDTFGRPIIEESVVEKVGARRPEFVMFLDRNGAPILDKYGSPVKNIVSTNYDPANGPKYGMLLDKNETPIRDSSGAPVKVNLDPTGRPLLNENLKLGGQRPKYVRFLDENGMPVLDQFGSPLKEIIPVGGSRAKYALLTDYNEKPLRDGNGDAITVNLDSLGKPIINKSVLDRLDGLNPAYAIFLDGKGAPISDGFGNVVKEKIGDIGMPRYALLLDENEVPLRDNTGKHITTNLDALNRSILDDNVLERVANQKVKYALPLDSSGTPIINRGKELLATEPIYDQFGNKIKPKYGLVLDSNETPIKDSMGGSIKVALDPYRRPIFSDNIVETIRSQQPQFVALLDAKGAPIVDKYGNIAKDPIYKSHNQSKPCYAVLLDQEGQIEDLSGNLIKLPLDSLRRPVISDVDYQRFAHRKPEDVMYLDRNGAPILNHTGDTFIEPIANYFEEFKRPLVDKYGNPIDVDNVTLVDKTGRTILDQYGVPAQIKLDPFGRPILRDVGTSTDLDHAVLVDRHGRPINDDANTPLQLKAGRDGTLRLHNTGLPVLDATGTQLRVQEPKKLLNYTPMTRYEIPENATNPTQVNIGIIKDVHYPEMLPEIDEKQAGELQEYTPSYIDETYDTIPECHRCKKIFEDNALAIQIERSEAMWHSGCFKCAGCNQNLADLVYFYDVESDDIYCGRDFAKIRGIPRCNACDELIFVKEYCLAENETYHVKHFCCFECDTPLAGQQYVTESNQPLCISCYEKLKADKCIVCQNIIKPDEQGANLNGNHFHADDVCFACKVCKKPLLGAKFLFRNNNLFCSGQCFNADK